MLNLIGFEHVWLSPRKRVFLGDRKWGHFLLRSWGREPHQKCTSSHTWIAAKLDHQSPHTYKKVYSIKKRTVSIRLLESCLDISFDHFPLINEFLQKKEKGLHVVKWKSSKVFRGKRHVCIAASATSIPTPPSVTMWWEMKSLRLPDRRREKNCVYRKLDRLGRG